jgi:Uma2 family endonuclease
VVDIAGWRRERMPKLPAVPAFELAPDWVCEVISPSTMRFDRSRKLRIYKREKVSHVWIVDPLARTLEIFRLDGKSWTLVAVHGEEADEKVRAEPFDAVELEPARWWLPDEPKAE